MWLLMLTPNGRDGGLVTSSVKASCFLIEVAVGLTTISQSKLQCVGSRHGVAGREEYYG